MCSTSHLRIPSRPAARQHMRQHGKFEKIRSKKSSNAWVFHDFLNFLSLSFFEFFQGSGSLEPIQNDVFWCPEGPGTIPDWFPIDLGNIIFSSKFSFFWSLMSTFEVQKLICISKLWPIWDCRLLKWSNTPRASENHPDLSDRSRDIHQTKLKRDLKSEPKLSRKFSMCGNYSEQYLLYESFYLRSTGGLRAEECFAPW